MSVVKWHLLTAVIKVLTIPKLTECLTPLEVEDITNHLPWFMDTSRRSLLPGGRTLLISRRNASRKHVALARNELRPLGTDILLQESATADDVKLDELESAAGYERYSTALGPPLSHARLVAVAHKQALERARNFDEPWTAILEDDVHLLPIVKERWLAGFDAAWAFLHSLDWAMIRLGWCQFQDTIREAANVGDGFYVVRHIWSKNPFTDQAVNGLNEGACTTGYIVNKKYINDVLALFPVHEAVDLALSHNFWDVEPFSSKVYSITHEDAPKLYKGWATFDQEGLLAQDQRKNVQNGKVDAITHKGASNLHEVDATSAYARVLLENPGFFLA